MDCLGPLEIAYVELTGVLLFKEERFTVGGIMAFQVYAIKTALRIVVIRPGHLRHKRIGLRWLKKKFDPIFRTPTYSRIECIKFLIKEINIKKVYWKHRITERAMICILEAINKSKEIYYDI